MSGKAIYPGPVGPAEVSQKTKGKRKVPSGGHDNPTAGPSNLPATAALSGERRQPPTLAPMPAAASTNPESAPAVESEPLQLHKRPRVNYDLQTPSLGDLARPEMIPTSEQSMFLTNNTRNHRAILDIDTSLGGSNALPIANVVIQGSESQFQNLATVFDPFPDHHNTSQVAAACYFGPPSMVHPPPITAIAGNSQVPFTQASSVGCCPQCHVMLRNLREGIIAVACGQGLPSGGGAMGELWKSYFGLEDHWNEGHMSRVGVSRMS